MNSVYRNLRKKIGTQETVAKKLGVSRITIVRRERGYSRVTEEHLNALRSIIKTPGQRVTISHLDRKRGMQVSKVMINDMLKASGCDLTYVDEYKTFSTRCGKLFREIVSNAME